MSKTKKTVATPPWCPFCGQKVSKASDAFERKMHEFKVGRCQCGAVYSCDPTGKNLGSAIVETLVFACDNNWDFAWDLMPEDDYLTGRVENYDESTHQVVDTRNLDGRAVGGVLYFVRLHTEISEISKRVKEKKEQQAESVLDDAVAEMPRPEVEPGPDPSQKRKKANKKLVKELAEAGDIDSLVGLCFDDKKTLRLLQRLLYAPSEEERWKTATLIGAVCGRVASREPGQVSEMLHRLFEACSDSAATPWGMVETLGAIIGARPDIFGAFARHLLNYLGDESTRVQVVWALNQVAVTRPDLIRATPFYNLFQFLNDPNPAMRGQVARLLGLIRADEASMQLMPLASDDGQLDIWEEDRFNRYSVADLSREAVSRIQQGE
ncbi:MAG: DVU0298 family protein [Thermodesulfobacteriota bacterium]